MAGSESEKQTGKTLDSFREACSRAGRLLDYRGPGNVRVVPVFVLLLALAVSMMVGTSIRLESSDLPFTDALAANHHDNLILQDAALSAIQKSPNLPREYVDRQAEETLRNAREANAYSFSAGSLAGFSIPDLKAEDSRVSETIKSYFRDEEGTAYLPDIDTYYWYRYAENVVETGEVADEIRDGKKFDNRQLAPLGLEIDLPTYAYAIAYFHKIMGKPVALLLGKPESLTLSFAAFPVFLMALVSLLVFLITRSMAGGMAGFFAAVLVGVHPNLMGRTLFGRGDSDAFVIFLAVLVTWCVVNAFASSSLRWRVFWAALGGLATGVYSSSWPGWWWIFVLMTGASGLSVAAVVLYQVAAKNVRKDFKTSEINFLKLWNDFRSSVFQIGTARNLSVVLAYFFSSALFVSVFSGFSRFLFALFPSVSASANIKAAISDSVLPNVLRTVAELTEGSVRLGISHLGGWLIFAVAAAGIAFLFLKDFFSSGRETEEFRHGFSKNVFFVLLIALWLGVTLFAVTRGVRFTILAVPALSIAVGLAFGIAGEWLASFFNKHFKAGKPAAFVFGFAVVLALGFFTAGGLVERSFETARGDVPIVNDAWFNSLTKIKNGSEENAIITSWWDFGHHFKYIADRPVTFDGATQTEPQAHWVGRMLSTSNEREAVGILRMLNCGARSGTDRIRETVGDPARSFEITKRIILENRSEALRILMSENFSGESANGVLERTHCDPPESFVIASDDMIGKAGVWGHFGAWNFTRADLVNSLQGKTLDESVGYAVSKFGMSRKEAEDLFFEIQLLLDDTAKDNWISPWPSFFHIEPNCLRQGRSVRCDSGIAVDLETMEVALSFEDALPRSLSYLSEEGVVRKEYENSTVGYSLLVFPRGKTSYGAILASPEIVDGIFVRMFFLEGHGLECFSFFTRETILGGEVYVWKTDWECGQKNVISGLVLEAVPGDSVSVSYIGYFDNRTVFDSSIGAFSYRNVTPGHSLLNVPLDRPLNFTLGRGQVIPGFERGVAGMSIGEEKVIRVPPEEGYADPGHHLYNKTLNFRVRLVGIT